MRQVTNWNLTSEVSLHKKKEVMLHNVGKIDRIVRLSVALVLVALYYFKVGNGQFDNYFVFGAGLLFITSMRRCCPLYAILGFGTCGIQTDEKDQVVKPKKINLK